MKIEIFEKKGLKVSSFSLLVFCLLGSAPSYSAIQVRSCWQTIQNFSQPELKAKNRLRKTILTASGELKNEFIGQKGLILLAKTHFKEKPIDWIFQTGKDTLPKPLFDQLKWKIFYGSVQIYDQLSQLSQEPESFMPIFEDVEGYELWANRYFNGDMEKAFLNAKALFSSEIFSQLNWDIFYGSTSRLEYFRNLPLFERGQVHENLKGIKGYVLFSLNITGGDMKKAYMNVKATLNEVLMSQLEWPYFDGNIRAFDSLENYIFKIKGRDNFITEFKKTLGFLAFIEQYHWMEKQKNGAGTKQFSYRGQEDKAFNNVSALLGPYYELLDWGESVSNRNGLDFSLRGVLFKEDASIREDFIREFKGAVGYLRFSEKYFSGDMSSAFEYVNTHLKNRFYWLRWTHQFSGIAEDFKSLREKILNSTTQLPEKRFKGIKGLLLFSNLYFSNNRQMAFDSVFRVLDRSDFDRLKWKNPESFERHLNHLKAILFDKNGKVLQKWKGMKGYLKLSIEHYPNRSMRVAFDKARLLGGRELIRQLKWKIFYGSPEEFKSFKERLSEPKNLKEFLKKFKGVKGQILFAQEFDFEDVNRVFINVFTLLDKNHFDQLNWKRFNIPLDKLLLIYDLVFNEKGIVRESFIEKYKGIKGQALFSERFLNGSMYQSYLNISFLIGTAFFRIEWEKISGSVDDFKLLNAELFDEEGAIRMEYRGSEGFLLFCKSYFPNRDMWGIYRNAFILLGKERFQQTNWQAFNGVPDEFKILKERLIREDGSLNSSYFFIDGMIRLALENFNGNLRKTFDNVSAVLDPEYFNQLRWKKFYTFVRELWELEDLIFEKDEIVREDFIEKYKGMKGLVKLSNQLNMGLDKIAKNVFLLLQGTEQEAQHLNQLKWKMFYGFPEDFNITRAYFFNTDGSLNSTTLQQYKGKEGMIQFAKQMSWTLKQTFSNVSAVLPLDLFDELKWVPILNVLKKSSGKPHITDLIFNKEGFVNESFIEKYKGMSGLIEFSEEFFDGNMRAAFVSVSSAMKRFKSDFNRLNWRTVYGYVYEYRNLQPLIFNKDGSLREEFVREFQGMEGYVKFARSYSISPSGFESERFAPYRNSMERAFVNVSAMMNPHFDQMGWRVFQGSVERFGIFKNTLLNGDGSPRDEFKGMDQMARFADLHAGGNMILVHKNASALLGGSKQVSKLLDWQAFHGQSSQFYTLIEDFNEHYPEGWIGPEGQKRIADKIFQGDQRKLKKNVSAIKGWLFGEEKQLKVGRKDTGNPQYYFFIKNQKFKELNWN